LTVATLRLWTRSAFVIVIACSALAACGDDESAALNRDDIIRNAQSMVPQDARLAELYELSCKTCHTDPENGAPLTGDKAAWRPVMKKEMDVLLDNVLNGFEGMPPLGQCFECQQEDFESMIRFMAGEGE